MSYKSIIDAMENIPLSTLESTIDTVKKYTTLENIAYVTLMKVGYDLFLSNSVNTLLNKIST